MILCFDQIGQQFDDLFKEMNIPRVLDEEKLKLTIPFHEHEIWKTLKDMHPTKAPRPDGIHAKFYHKHWGTIGTSISNLILDCLNNKFSIAKLNELLLL